VATHAAPSSASTTSKWLHGGFAQRIFRRLFSVTFPTARRPPPPCHRPIARIPAHADVRPIAPLPAEGVSGRILVKP
jgi:hypothetical protein